MMLSWIVTGNVGGMDICHYFRSNVDSLSGVSMPRTSYAASTYSTACNVLLRRISPFEGRHEGCNLGYFKTEY